MFMSRRLASALINSGTILLIAAYPLHSFSQLTEIGPGVVSDGSLSSAKFYVGAAAGSGEVQNRFTSRDLLTVEAEIAVEPAHVGSIGRLFVIADTGGEFLMQNASGGFQVWDGSLPTLVGSRKDAALLASERLQVFDDLDLAPLAVAGLRLKLYLGYSLNAAADTIYYSSSPFELQIDEYQPLASASAGFQVLDTATLDADRDREIPTLVYMPTFTEPAAVILFSHGLGGTRFAATYLFEHLASRGYVVVSMQHPGSDAAIYEGLPASQILAAFIEAATVSNLLLRIDDVSAVINQLTAWNSNPDHVLHQRMDLERIGMSGHSFGARTTQATSGEVVSFLGFSTREPRIKAAIPYSTSIPDRERAEELLAGVAIPWLVMTGTNDLSPVGGATVADRLAVFPALPAGDKYELVLFGGEHNAFTENTNTASENFNPAHHSTISALSTAFWDAYLSGDLSARAWLQGGGVNTVLSEGDTWHFK